ncbi:hypothetical protein ACH5RR_026790 [Cinchona calisaya]|uniref:Acetyl-coenzyme A carboxylase carboxyl transferase subunit beta domain-containing protein n=1 Tax=Cinchona calisaya TaxID=153742 RepID=A0ABD2Z4M1_9GENT
MHAQGHKETFTLTYVTSRTVGIGACLARLGMRCIQRLDQPIILTVSDDLERVSSVLKRLSFVPPYSGGPRPQLTPLDPPDRPVKYLPENSCNPRAAICGASDGSRNWLGGIFDRDSFVETLEGWARTVVT